MRIRLICHVISRKRSANFTRKYGDLGTPATFLQRLKINISYLVNILNTTMTSRRITNYP